jgi:hypothetical protein
MRATQLLVPPWDSAWSRADIPLHVLTERLERPTCGASAGPGSVFYGDAQTTSLRYLPIRRASGPCERLRLDKNDEQYNGEHERQRERARHSNHSNRVSEQKL